MTKFMQDLRFAVRRLKNSSGSTFAVVFTQALFGAAAAARRDIASGADAEVKDFQLQELEARLKTTPPGYERDYFSGVLANREGLTEMSIQLLESALSSIRLSQPRRAAVALEALADDYNKSFRYKEAALTDDDLLKNFTSYVDPRKLQGAKDDAG